MEGEVMPHFFVLDVGPRSDSGQDGDDGWWSFPGGDGQQQQQDDDCSDDGDDAQGDLF
jgi:hypothetical protein